MWIVTGNQRVSRLTTQPIANPFRRIVWLEIATGREFRERVARPPERFCGFFCAQLAAVPHDGRLYAERSDIFRKPLDGLSAPRRKRAPRIDLRSERVAMVHDDEPHGGILRRGRDAG